MHFNHFNKFIETFLPKMHYIHSNEIMYNLGYANRQFIYNLTNTIVYVILYFINIIYHKIAHSYNKRNDKKSIELFSGVIDPTILTSSPWYEIVRSSNSTQRLKSFGVFSFGINPANEYQIQTTLVSVDTRTFKPFEASSSLGYLYNRDNTKWYNISFFAFPQPVNVLYYEPGNGTTIVNYMIISDNFRKNLHVLTKTPTITSAQYEIIENKLHKLDFKTKNLLTYGVTP